MDRLHFASEGVLAEVADMYPASHDGFSVKCRLEETAIQGGALISAGFPCKPHIRRELIPATVPHSGRGELQENGTTLYKRRDAPCRTTVTFPRIAGLFRVGSAGRTPGTDQAAGFRTAPSGATPSVTNRHSAISSFRARATTMILRTRRPVGPTRSRNQQT